MATRIMKYLDDPTLVNLAKGHHLKYHLVGALLLYKRLTCQKQGVLYKRIDFVLEENKLLFDHYLTTLVTTTLLKIESNGRTIIRE